MKGGILALATDIDGVIVDSEGWQLEGWNAVLMPHGKRVTGKDYLEYAGLKGEEIERLVAEKFGLSGKPGFLIAPKEKLIKEWLRTRKVRLMPRARRFLGFFAERGIPIAAVSSVPARELELKLERAGIRGFFAELASKDEVRHSKPAPDIYLLAARKLGAKPQECLSVEDTEPGVASAKAAGMTCIAVPNRYTQGQDFGKADFMAKSLAEALEWARKHF